MSGVMVMWSLALACAGAGFVSAATGLWLARRKRIAAHRRMMLLAGALVGLFVVVYLAKVILFGREPKAEWTDVELVVLRVHEVLVAVFLIAGARAAWLSRRLTVDPAGGPEEARDRRHHRLAGRIAVGAYGLAMITAVLNYQTLLRHRSRAESGSAAEAAASIATTCADTNSCEELRP